jgi:hypothetical protein
LFDGSIATALGVSTCPSPDPIDANIERKLHDADAALVHNSDATTRGTQRSSQYFLFRETRESFIRSVGALNDFIWVSFRLKIGLGVNEVNVWLILQILESGKKT